MTTPFDLTADLPTGLTVLEASAGTGKTWAISALAVRYLADGAVTAPRLLAITFTHLASADLRSRLYQRLLGASDALKARLAGHSRTGEPDLLIDVLATGPAEQQAARLQRLEQAIADFDAATVATIHEFCRRASDWLGPRLSGRPASLDDDTAAALAAQTVADATLRHQMEGGRLTPAACAALGRAALRHPGLAIEPDGDPAAVFMAGCRGEYARRKAAAGVADFDDLARQLDLRLSDPASGPAVAESLAERYHVVLVDEFQDTDTVQWSILRQAFAGRRPMVLVGDPKQSIYGFRGADVNAYLDAVQQADASFTLPVNHRSDRAVVDGVNAVFGDADFGQAGASIPMRPSLADHTQARLRGGQTPSGVEIRRVAATGAARRAAVEADAVGWVARCLSGDSQLFQDGNWRRVRADDIAVLVSSNKRGEAISQALRDAGVPAVFSGVASVFASAAAGEWLTLLDALANPRPDTLRRAMAGQLIGLSLAQLADPAGEAPVAWAARLREWAAASANPSAILDQLEAWADLSPRLLRQPDGERVLTDVKHLGELLARQARSNPTMLDSWLRQQQRRAADAGSGDRTRRLETDRPAVSVLTVHAAKGLEFPIVLVPAAADASRHAWASADYPLVVRPPDRPGSPRVIDTTTDGQGLAGLQQAWADEQAAEDKRRLYVALTRGSSLVVAWLGDRQATLSQLMAGWAAGERPAGVRITDAPGLPIPVLSPPSRPPLPDVNTFRRRVDDTWTRTSYSGLTSGLHGAVTDAVGGLDEEPVAPAETATPDGGAPSLMDALPAGAAFGTIVHAVLETVDPASGTLRDDLAAAAASLRDSSTLPDLDVGRLADALVGVLRTPLGPLTGGASLATLGAGRRLAELGFELPLGGADARRVKDLAALFDDRALLPGDDPLAAYGASLAGSAAAERTLRGFLTGSIDAIHELPDGRAFLVDYKTNRLGPYGGPDPIQAYTRAAMARAMIDAHYPLQALLYGVALRRYLGWRRPDTPFEEQWAGVAYLFVRGMSGPDTPTSDGWPCGVFGWTPGVALIEAADAVLRGDAA